VLEGALILAVGILIGIVVRSLPARRRGTKPVEAVCGCGHHLSYHDPKTRACGYASSPVVKSTATITEYGKAMQCPCLAYTGPLPLHTYIPTEIAGE
jgi:hypothetical protein